MQRLGIKRAFVGDQPNDITNFLQAVQARGSHIETATQADLFGADDAAIRQAEMMARRAGAIQREIGDQILSVSGAAKRPEKAAALGVDVRNPADVQFRLAQLQALRDRARNWAIDDQIRNLVSHGEQSPAEVVRMLQTGGEISQTPQLRSGEEASGELFQGADQPFNLAGETGTDFGARQADIERDARTSAEAAAAQEQSQTKLFGAEAARSRRFFKETMEEPPNYARRELKHRPAPRLRPLRPMYRSARSQARSSNEANSLQKTGRNSRRKSRQQRATLH